MRLLFDTIAHAVDHEQAPRGATTIQWEFPDAPPWHLRIDNGSTPADRRARRRRRSRPHVALRGLRRPHRAPAQPGRAAGDPSPEAAREPAPALADAEDLRGLAAVDRFLTPCAGRAVALAKAKKERREQARAERKEAEAAAQARAHRTKRLYQLGAVVLAAVAVVVIAVVISSSGGSDNTTKPPAQGQPASGAAQSTPCSPASPKGNALGNPKAPVTLQEFADLQCPICQAYTENALPTLIRDYVRPGKVRMVFHNLPMSVSRKSNGKWLYIRDTYNSDRPMPAPVLGRG